MTWVITSMVVGLYAMYTGDLITAREYIRMAISFAAEHRRQR